MIFIIFYFLFFFFKQKTAYEMRISDWSSDVCSSDLGTIFAKAGGWTSCYKRRKHMAEGNYGTRHLMEEEMREKGMGVFENKMAPAPENKSLSSMTKADLIALAEKEGTDLTDATNNDERIAAIEKARKAK